MAPPRTDGKVRLTTKALMTAGKSTVRVKVGKYMKPSGGMIVRVIRLPRKSAKLNV